MRAFWQAVAFLTRIPVPRYPFTAADWSKSAVYYPVVGALLGLMLWGVSRLSAWLLTDLLAAVLTLVFWIAVTGGLHLDGWMDLADGLGSSRPREQALAIMKDSRVGAMGVLAVCCLLLAKGAALYELLALQWQFFLLLVPLIVRTHLLVAIRCWPYVTRDGSGCGLSEGLRPGLLFCVGAVVAAVCWWLGSYPGLFVYCLTLLYTAGFSHYIRKRLGGYTGDAYGALIESTETLALVLLVAGAQWLG